MRCPICGRKTFFRGNPHRPFCSQRCKLLDLHNWLSDRYRIATSPEEGGKVRPGPVPEPSAKGSRG